MLVAGAGWVGCFLCVCVFFFCFVFFLNTVVSAVITQHYLSFTTGGVLPKYWLSGACPGKVLKGN